MKKVTFLQSLPSNDGFTLAELLIALGILAILAMFTIPKLLSSQQANQNTAVAKEYLGTFSEAYHQKKLNGGGITPTTFATELTPYMNYVKVDSTTVIDNPYGGSFDCSVIPNVCIKFANGAIARFDGTNRYCTGASTDYIDTDLDPNGRYDGWSNNSAVSFSIYYNGKITTTRGAADGTCYNSSVPVYWGAGDTSGPWFKW